MHHTVAFNCIVLLLIYSFCTIYNIIFIYLCNNKTWMQPYHMIKHAGELSVKATSPQFGIKLGGGGS